MTLDDNFNINIYMYIYIYIYITWPPQSKIPVVPPLSLTKNLGTNEELGSG